jgi:Fic family protein
LESKKIKYSDTDEYKQFDGFKQMGLLVEKESIQQLPQNLPRRNNKTKTKKKYDEVKKEVLKSYKQDRNLTGEVVLKLENTEKCIETLKTLERPTLSAERINLIYNIQKGEVLKKIKDLEKGGYLKKLQENGIPYKISHCNFLIKLYKFSLDHSNIIHCSLSLHFLQKHWSVIPTIFNELKW